MLCFIAAVFFTLSGRGLINVAPELQQIKIICVFAKLLQLKCKALKRAKTAK